MNEDVVKRYEELSKRDSKANAIRDEFQKVASELLKTYVKVRFTIVAKMVAERLNVSASYAHNLLYKEYRAGRLPFKIEKQGNLLVIVKDDESA